MEQKILIVDDDKMLRDVLQEFLEGIGYACVQAEDANEALEKYDSSIHKLLIIDRVMPGMDGIELMETIKENNPDQKIIIMTGYPFADSAYAALFADDVDYIIKPFRFNEIATLIKSLI